MPCRIPPHKARLHAHDHDRVAMLNLAIEERENFVTDLRELMSRRTSYTVLSLRDLREDLGPDASIVFIIGWDSLKELSTWYEWQSIFKYANLFVATRPDTGGALDSAVQIELDARLTESENLAKFSSGRIALFTHLQEHISSTAIRAQLSEANFEVKSVDEKVLFYIKNNGIYST